MDSKPRGRSRNFEEGVELDRLSLLLPATTVEEIRDYSKRHKIPLAQVVHSILKNSTKGSVQGQELQVAVLKRDNAHLREQVQKYSRQSQQYERHIENLQRQLKHKKRAIMVLSRYLRDQHSQEAEKVLAEDPGMQADIRKHPPLAPGYKSRYHVLVQEEIKKAILDCPDYPGKNLVTHLKGMPLPELDTFIAAKAVVRNLSELLRKGEILRSGEGGYHDPYTYRLRDASWRPSPPAEAPPAEDEHPLLGPHRERMRQVSEERIREVEDWVLWYLGEGRWMPEDFILEAGTRAKKIPLKELLGALSRLSLSDRIWVREATEDRPSRDYMQPSEMDLKSRAWELAQKKGAE